ncbi:hypothetical protein GOP47_0028634 [Adiantum capillus-veneris]|nr:hypothetical protein GOP47_0028634 [Adiantum capillus-veneris]
MLGETSFLAFCSALSSSMSLVGRGFKGVSARNIGRELILRQLLCRYYSNAAFASPTLSKMAKLAKASFVLQLHDKLPEQRNIFSRVRALSPTAYSFVATLLASVMPFPVAISGCNTSMGERACDKGWPSLGILHCGKERVEHGAHVTAQINGLDSQLWHACAGALVHLPQVGAKVIYFPQGHAEHAALPPEFPHTLSIACTVLCRVLSVNFLADGDTDEVYARIRLQPDPSIDLTDDASPSPPLSEKTASFAKTLTQSDANNGGGFSVPRYCAETIFPRLDYSEDPPVQIVLAKDVHGAVWRFRHIYRGTPRRHLLTTGWSSFVNQKKLVAGDAIVFLRSASGELCVGVRRSAKGGTGGGGGGAGMAIDSSPRHISHMSSQQASRWEPKSLESPYDFFGICRDGSMRASRTSSDNMTNFARNRARVTASAVLEAATLAASNEPFEVVYYPRATISEFCVKASVVKASLQQNWAPGMRFKMAVETEDASRISWFMGTIAKVQEADSLRWPNSPWKMLQVTWDEPDLLQGITRVSPWQVELVSSMQLPPFSLPKKKMRLLQPPEFQHDGQGMMGFPMAAFSSNMLGPISPWQLGFVADNVSVGMQGARQDRSYGLAMSDFRPSNIKPFRFWENFDNLKEPTTTNSGQVSTELSMSNFVSQGSSSTLSTLLTVGSSNSELTLSSNGPSWNKDVISKSKVTPFLLFGKAIDTSQSLRSPPAQISDGSSSDCQGRETLFAGNQSEGLERKGSFISSQASLVRQEEACDPMLNEIVTLKWFNEPTNSVDTGNVMNVPDNSFNHCKVFRESDDVGRTVDLSMFDSYEELYEKLSLLFGIHKPEILGRLVCLDSMGSSAPIGEEPYRNFTKKAKRLKILSESSSESFTR